MRVIIIPARLQSSRLPNKVLAEIAGKPMIQHTYERARQSQADLIFIATDSLEVKSVVEEFGAECVMTREDHPTGTDRVIEATSNLKLTDQDLVLNLQCDEPLIPIENLEQVMSNLEQHPEAAVTTLCEPITAQEAQVPSQTKVVRDKNGFALYFSRSVIPTAYLPVENQAMPSYFRHVGLYCFRPSFLKRCAKWSPCEIEQAERLEQLRWLYQGERIHVDVAKASSGAGVDTPADLERVRALLSQKTL
ncbi:MAG: 3-deoxy-manno-octulosonate cytidylyltransferase [Gammaproteobacteria bacterium]|nr:3-deoxy-manno-octulosonate cytidylyltransferase [Gammaproteobacteria bacterium]